MGEVYEVEQVSTGKRRALKLMKPELTKDPGLLARFEQEAKIGSRIESDHVVEVVGAGIDVALGAPWLAMELLQGESLGDLVRRRGSVPPHEARVLFAQLGHALGAAHRAGVVHRDLKPENIFVARVQQLGVDFKVKVLDFGIAKLFADANASHTGAMTLGTPRFMAPEQTGGQPISPQTDVWAIGLIAFYVLTGRYYWKRALGGPGENVMTLMREVLFEPLVPASRRAAELGGAMPPEGFDAWFARCVAREPAERFKDADEAQEALDRVLVTGSATRRVAGGAPAPSYPIALTSTVPTMPSPGAAPLGESTSGVSAPVAPSAPTAATAPAPTAPRPTVAQTVGPKQKSPALLIGIVAGALVVTGVAGVFGFKAWQKHKREKAAQQDDEESAASGKTGKGGTKLPADLAGEYKANGKGPGGKAYAVDVSISKEANDAFVVEWSSGFAGIGLKSGDLLGVGWEGEDARFFGVGIYDIEGGKLTGKLVSASRPGEVSTQTLEGPPGLSGLYSITAQSRGAGMGLVTMSKSGDVIDVTYTYPAAFMHGVGLVSGKKLVVGFGPRPSDPGVMVYVAQGGRLEGRWARRSDFRIGTETLKR